MPDDHAPRLHAATFRFYGGLNDFLPPDCRQQALRYRFSGSPGLRDSIQAQGVPHTEVALVLVDGTPRPPAHRLAGDERVSVYPRFQHLAPDGDGRWDRPLPDPARFILDVHLGKLCRHLRLLGFDSRWGNDFDDPFIIDTALAERRVILTRDLGILKQGRVRWGYFVRNTAPARQIAEVIDTFALDGRCRPLSRCINCNGLLQQVRKAAVIDRLPEGTRRCYDTFYQCLACRQVYWRGAHYLGLMGKLAAHRDKRAAAVDSGERAQKNPA